MILSLSLRKASGFLTVICCLAASHLAWSIERWREVSAEEFRQEAPLVDPESNAEYLFLEMKAAQVFTERDGIRGYKRYYARLKVFNEAGVESLSQFRIRYGEGERISKIVARTVKPDGRVAELDREDVYDVERVKTRDDSLREKAFAFPSLEVGDIVEYQVEVDIDDTYSVFFQFTNRFPAQRVTARLKPAVSSYFANRIIAFGFPSDQLDNKDGDYYFLERVNQRAELDEVFAMPKIHTEPTVAMYYTKEYLPDRDEFWRAFVLDLIRDGAKDFKPKKEVKEKAAHLVKGVKGDKEKLRALFDYCMGEVVNLHWDRNRLGESERLSLKDNKNAQDTLRNGYGKPRDLRGLFGALARAAGFETCYGAIADRRFVHFTPSYTVRFALEDRLVAVKVGKEWLFFDPGNPALGFGEVTWFHSGMDCLMGQGKSVEFVRTPEYDSKEAVTEIEGDFEVSKEGTLKGRVKKTFHGPEAYEIRLAMRKKTTDEMNEELKKREEEDFDSAKVESIVYQNMDTPASPLIVEYDLTIDDFAQALGKRLILSPSVFHKDEEPIFQEEERVSDIVFPYPWKETCSVSLKLPDGYEFEAGDGPKPFEVGDVFSFDANVKMNKKTNTIFYNRSFEVKRGQLPPKAFPVVREIFRTLELEDSKGLTLKKEEESHA